MLMALLLLLRASPLLAFPGLSTAGVPAPLYLMVTLLFYHCRSRRARYIDIAFAIYPDGHTIIEIGQVVLFVLDGWPAGCLI